MRPETEKLIEEIKTDWPDPEFSGSEVIFLSRLQQIIDSETGPFLQEIEIWKERLQAEKDVNDISRLRDEFAMRAPVNIPNWFYPEAETYEQKYFKWRYHYADEMLKHSGRYSEGDQ
jgi:hypothetical protein